MQAIWLDFRIALLSLFEHRRRALFLGIAVTAVTTLLVLLNGLSDGIRRTLIDTAVTLSTGHLNVGGHLHADDTTQALFGPGLVNTAGAHIHLADSGFRQFSVHE